MDESLPVLAVDLTFARLQGHGYGNLANWDEPATPYIGQPLIAADGGTERLEGVVSDVRPDGVIVISFSRVL